jgi:magnesium chelatase family protein
VDRECGAAEPDSPAQPLQGTQVLPRHDPGIAEDTTNHLDLRDIKGQETAKRALEVAAAGGHQS